MLWKGTTKHRIFNYIIKLSSFQFNNFFNFRARFQAASTHSCKAHSQGYKTSKQTKKNLRRKLFKWTSSKSFFVSSIVHGKENSSLPKGTSLREFLFIPNTKKNFKEIMEFIQESFWAMESFRIHQAVDDIWDFVVVLCWKLCDEIFLKTISLVHSLARSSLSEKRVKFDKWSHPGACTV